MNIKNLSLSNDDKISLISSLATMLAAGIPLLEIIESLLEDSKGNLKKLLESVKTDTIQGNHIYSAFEKFPQIFDKVTINIIKASEEAGTLEKTLFELKESMQSDIEFKDKIKSALSYPVLILVVFAGIMLLMLTFVIPKISFVFSRMKVNLPLPTKIMIFISNILMQYTLPIILASSVSIIILTILLKKNRRLILNAFFLLPIVSNLARLIDLTKFSKVLCMLLSSGIPITKALILSEEVVTKKDIAKTIKDLTDTVQSGKRLSEGMKKARKIFPILMIKLVEAGEKSGTLESTMMDISKNLDYQVSKSLKSLTTLLEPIMMVFVGILVGGMMLAIIAPIYGLMGQVGR